MSNEFMCERCKKQIANEIYIWREDTRCIYDVCKKCKKQLIYWEEFDDTDEPAETRESEINSTLQGYEDAKLLESKW